MISGPLRLILSHAILLVLAAATAASTPAFATDFDPPMIEIGGGVEAHASGPINVLLRVSVEGVTVTDPGHYALVIAKMRGDLALHSLPTGEGNRIPYLDIEFVPASLRLPGGLSGGELRILPTHVGTNIHLNQDVNLRVDVAGVEMGYLGPSGINERTLLYAKLAADALGYKMASRLSDAGADNATFRGFDVGALNGEAGLVFAPGNASFKVRVAFGANADLNVGGNVGHGFALESDLGAYSEVSLDIKKFMSLFVRNSYRTEINSGFDTQSEYQLLLGAIFIF
jgi:hypothetical protein